MPNKDEVPSKSNKELVLEYGVKPLLTAVLTLISAYFLLKPNFDNSAQLAKFTATLSADTEQLKSTLRISETARTLPLLQYQLTLSDNPFRQNAPEIVTLTLKIANNVTLGGSAATDVVLDLDVKIPIRDRIAVNYRDSNQSPPANPEGNTTIYCNFPEIDPHEQAEVQIPLESKTILRGWLESLDLSAGGALHCHEDCRPTKAGESYIPPQAYHTVKSGETLFSIGRLYDVNPYELAQKNTIAYPYIMYPDQVLAIP
jgi:hypothetical protein